MQCINLPVLMAADVIVDVTISLNKPMASAASSNMEIHTVTAPWDIATITLATQPDREAAIADYAFC